jgi:tRNA A-37 threonylcarbamoyl transferase component Bud32
MIYCKEGFHGKLTFCGAVEMGTFKIEDEPNTKGFLTNHALKLTRFNVQTKKKKKKDAVVWILCFETAEEKDLWTKTLLDAIEHYTTEKNYNEASALLTALLDPSTLSYSDPPVGEGATGIVYKGLYRGEKQVAIKKIKNVQMLSKAEKDAFISEVQILKAFQCPQIVEFVGCVVSPDNLWTVSEFVFMGTLKSFLTNMPSIPLRFKVLFMLDIARGLEYLHKHSIMHRDIKSDNVLVANVSVSAVTRVKLTDFGASRIVRDKAERNYTRIGTPIYVSPEGLFDL